MLKLKALILCALFFSFYYAVAQNPPSESSEIDKEILWQAQKFQFLLKTIYQHYVDSVNIHKVSESAFNEMLKSLDPNCDYFTADEKKALKDRSEGNTIGIGLNLVSINDTLIVHSLAKNSPADSAGICSGDKILFINGEKAIGQTTISANKLLTGEIGSKLSLIIKRGYSRSLQEYTLARNEYPIESIDTYYLLPETDIGYILISRFSKLTNEEFIKAACELQKQGMNKLILDLRNNPGGVLQQSTALIDEFLPDGKIITYTKGRNPDYNTRFKTSDTGDYEKLPLIILVDQNSASASEILAGAIQDLDRGLIVGEQTYGKASTQNLWDFKDGSGFKITVAHYYTPAGRDIQKPQLKDKPTLDPSFGLQNDKNTQDRLNKLIENTGGRTQLPIYKTEMGRPVIGGGGILPDYIVLKDTTTLLTKVLNQKGIFLEFTYNFLINYKSKIIDNFGDNYIKFVKNFNVDDLMINEFINISKKKSIWNENMYLTDIDIIKTLIKANVAESIWGKKASSSVMATIDKPLQRAIELFPEAERLISH